MTTNQTLLHLTDDSPGMRDTLEVLVKPLHFRVETHASMTSLLDAIESGRSGWVILNIRMFGPEGLELRRLLAERGLDVPILLFSIQDDSPIAVQAVMNGVIELIDSPDAGGTFADSMQEAMRRIQAHRQQQALCQAMLDRLATLSRREREVADLVAVGRLSKEIAAQFGLSKKTVDVHRTNIMRKLGVDSMAGLIQVMMRCGCAPTLPFPAESKGRAPSRLKIESGN